MSSFNCPQSAPAAPIVRVHRIVYLLSITFRVYYIYQFSSWVALYPVTELICLAVNVSLTDLDLSDAKVNDAPILPTNSNSPAINHNMISLVNSLQTTWTAGINNRFRDSTLSHVKGLCGVLRGGPKLVENSGLKQLSRSVDIPDAFDSREQWGDICPSTKDVRDQGACGSCWAFGAVEAMTDRICIASKGAQQPYLAAEDLVSCTTRSPQPIACH